MDLSKARRKKIQDRKKAIRNRKSLPGKSKCDAHTSYSQYLSTLKTKFDSIQSLLNQIKDLVDGKPKQED